MPDAQIRTTETGLAADTRHLLRGLCMGCADVVPGVSGGTVALILGIYERLVTAISRVDGQLLTHCRHGRWQEAARHLDLRFLVALAAGIGIGVVGMTLIINRLLTNSMSRAVTLAAFFGMILASAIVLAGLIRPQTRREAIRAWLLALVAAFLSYQISLLEQLAGIGEPSYWWLFACGAIAICAMILPGVSGAMILLVLGVYVHLTEVPHNVLHGELLTQSLTTVMVFGSGCAVGLILFSKVLRWLLTDHHVATMAVLCGLMVGALVKLWPFQHDLSPEIEKFKYKKFELFWPQAIDAQAISVLVAAVLALTLVFVTDYLVRTRKTSKHPE